jgi:hypothetical protein
MPGMLVSFVLSSKNWSICLKAYTAPIKAEGKTRE